MAYGDNFFTGMIDEEGRIWNAASGRKYQQVGIDIQKQDELQRTITEQQEIIENYYNKLVELGVIVPQKTPEEIAIESAREAAQIAREQAEQQSKINMALLEAIEGLKTEIKELKTNGHDNGYSNQLCAIKSEQNSINTEKTTNSRSTENNKPSSKSSNNDREANITTK